MSIADHPPDRLALELRRRAQAMRLLGQWLDRSPATTLALRAGPDVWTGPAAQQCADELGALARSLRVTADEVRLRAAHLERRADELIARSIAGPHADMW